MTVGEMIDELGKYDRKLPVEFIDSWDETASVESVGVSNDGNSVVLASKN